MIKLNEISGGFWISCGAFSGFLSVALGAFGAHALSAKLDEKAFKVFETATQYQFFHSLALILFGLFTLYLKEISSKNPGLQGQTNALPGVFFLLGILIFSGSLYALSLSGIKILGAITPIGGVCFLIGWACFAFSAFKL